MSESEVNSWKLSDEDDDSLRGQRIRTMQDAYQRLFVEGDEGKTRWVDPSPRYGQREAADLDHGFCILCDEAISLQGEPGVFEIYTHDNNGSVACNGADEATHISEWEGVNHDR